MPLFDDITPEGDVEKAVKKLRHAKACLIGAITYAKKVTCHVSVITIG